MFFNVCFLRCDQSIIVLCASDKCKKQKKHRQQPMILAAIYRHGGVAQCSFVRTITFRDVRMFLPGKRRHIWVRCSRDIGTARCRPVGQLSQLQIGSPQGRVEKDRCCQLFAHWRYRWLRADPRRIVRS